MIAKKKGKVFAASKHLYEKAALTPTGKKLIVSYAPEEIVDVLENFHKLLDKVCPKKAEEHYSNALSMIMKTLLLVKGKYATIEDFEHSKIPALKVWSSVIDFEKAENKKKAIEQLTKEVKELHNVLNKVLQPHLTPKSINHRLKPILELFEAEEVWEKIFSDESDKELVETRVNVVTSLHKVWESQVSKATQKKILNSKLIN